MKKKLLFVSMCITVHAAGFLFAQEAGFTYQGRLVDNGGLANGGYDLVFSLYDQQSGGTQLGPSLINSALSVSNGLFATALDFGPTNFSGADRWLEIAVRTNGSQEFLVLVPRQKITPSPYAIAALSLAGTVPSDKISGSYTNAVSFLNPANGFAGDGSGLTGLNAANLSSGLVPVALGGTGAGTPSGARASLGAAASGANSDITALTGLSTPLSLGQGGTGAGSAPDALANLGAASLTGSNTFAGVNVFSNGANLFAGGFAGDGSMLTNLNTVSLTGGALPSALLTGSYLGPLAFSNPADLFLGGFAGNGYGLTNVNASTLGGLAPASLWQLGGNAGTSAGSNFLGTTDGQALELKSGAGVAINTNDPAGKGLSVNGSIGITSSNTLEFGSDVAGKQQDAGKIGYQTFTPGALDIVGAGTNSTSRRLKFWAEAGATFNATGTNAPLTIVNTVDETTSVTLAAPYTTWQIGQNKPPDNRYAFDSFFVYQLTAATSRLLITSDGRVGLNTNSPVYPLHLGNGAYCTAGGQWTSVSDRNAKEAFTPIQPRQVLAKVASLPITQWQYKAETNGAWHLGPMAQDFYAAFGLGESDKSIGSIDANGVGLAAIQGLSQLEQEKDLQIRQLQARTQELEQRLEALEARALRSQRSITPAGDQ